jgi:membrane protease YdiL (CAAX protease family)
VGVLDPGVWAFLAGWVPLGAALAVSQALGRFCPPSQLLPRPRRRRDGRSLAELWDSLIGSLGHPAAAFLLKDVVTIWRANLMMARLLPLAIPLAMLALWKLSPSLAEVSAGVVTVPLLMLVSTALAASLFELAEGSEPPPVPFSRAQVALLKAAAAAFVTVGAAKMALLLAFPFERAWPLLPWTVAAAALMPLLLIELLAIHPGGASELFTRQGVRVAVLWTVVAVGTAGLAGELPWPQKLQVLAFAVALAWALWGRERVLCWDSSLADLAVVGSFFFFASRLAGLLAGLAFAFGPAWGTAASLLGTGLLQAGLLGFSVRYARLSSAPPDSFGLGLDRPLGRALGGAAAGLALAAAFAWLAGRGAGSPGLAMNLSGLMGMALASALGPVAEEFFFRGLVCRILWERLGRVAGLAGSAAVFALAHAGPPSLALFALGLLNGWLWGRRRSILEPVAAHLAYNHAQVVVAILAGELERVIGS